MKDNHFYDDEKENSLEFTEENLRNAKKNKHSRTSKMFKKFKNRVDFMNAVDPDTDHTHDHRFKNTGTPCSCPICKGERYGKKDRRKGWKEAFKQYAEEGEEDLVFKDFGDKELVDEE